MKFYVMNDGAITIWYLSNSNTAVGTKVQNKIKHLMDCPLSRFYEILDWYETLTLFLEFLDSKDLIQHELDVSTMIKTDI